MINNHFAQRKITLEELNPINIYTWVKDKKFRIVSCSENLCELAGEESPYGMNGKNDFSLVWHKDAAYFREKDVQIIKGEVKHINIYEIMDTVDKNGIIHKQPILITKTPLFNKNGKCIGIAGSHVNLSVSYAFDQTKPKSLGHDKKGRLWLPESLGKLYLTKKEVEILKFILLGKTSKQIAKVLNLSPRTIEEYTDKIKRKFQCTYKHQIHSVAIEHGITHLL